MPKICIIGGSGLYSLLENPEYVERKTEYGSPSDAIAIGKIGGVEVAFLPRHGRKHTIPPHKIPYKANIEALAELGIERILTSNAVGSLKGDYVPGDFAFFDQFINATHGRDDTFFHGPKVVHVSTAEPYCTDLRKIGISAAKKRNLRFHEKSTVVVINGPRFSTKAESRHFASMGADTINMTQYPEITLAKEKGMCYLGIGIITDYDAGLEGRSDVKPVSNEDVVKTFGRSIESVKGLLAEIVGNVPENRENCNCKDSLKGAEFSA